MYCRKFNLQNPALDFRFLCCPIPASKRQNLMPKHHRIKRRLQRNTCARSAQLRQPDLLQIDVRDNMNLLSHTTIWSSDLQEPLLEALHSKHFDRVQQILYNGQTPDFLDSSGQSPTEIAFAHEDEKSAVALKARADVRLELPRVGSLLHVACNFGFHTAVSELIKYGADVNAVDADGDPFTVAVCSGHLHCVTPLVKCVPAERLGKRDECGETLITLWLGGQHFALHVWEALMTCPCSRFWNLDAIYSDFDAAICNLPWRDQIGHLYC